MKALFPTFHRRSRYVGTEAGIGIIPISQFPEIIFCPVSIAVGAACNDHAFCTPQSSMPLTAQTAIGVHGSRCSIFMTTADGVLCMYLNIFSYMLLNSPDTRRHRRQKIRAGGPRGDGHKDSPVRYHMYYCCKYRVRSIICTPEYIVDVL